MATLKAEKLKRDEYEKKVENGIVALIASQKAIVEELKKLSARIKALEGKIK